jgi:transposase
VTAAASDQLGILFRRPGHVSSSKHHVIPDGQGVPLTAHITGANRYDSTQLRPLVQSVPPVRGKRGRPRRRPKALLGDCAYDAEPHRGWLRTMHVRPRIARRRTPHGSSLGNNAG